MDARLETLARNCLDAAEADTMTFLQIVGALIKGGFESYLIDFRRGAATYYLPNTQPIDLPLRHPAAEIGPRLDAHALQQAIREAQTLAPGYSYARFCRKAQAAGCAGYMVSFPGRRALYFGRDAATHVERFPGDD